jgi:(1->4)-alpha-D-glucan 1-alpha-D-glucosylmutase
VRARLDVISEIPREWGAQVMRWRRLNRGRKQTLGDGRTVPDYNEEYFLYQTLVGAWPLCTGPEEHRTFVQRIREYMNKAVHEAKVNLSWVNPNAEYVAALETFVERILGTEQHGGRGNAFREEIESFLPPLMFFGAMNSLAQLLIKITAPGVPDIYRGTELWDFSLVDPDNRRPVDFSLRERFLSELDTAAGQDLPGLLQDLLKNWRDGRIKLWTTLRALRFRREHRELFQSGSYAPLFAAGEKAEHCVAYIREYAGETVVVAVPRLAHTLMRGRAEPPLGDAWADTELPLAGGEREFTNVLSGERISGSGGRQLSCQELFARFPIVLLAAH